MINATYGEAANQTEDNALIAQGCTIIVRTDLLPQAPPPVTDYTLATFQGSPIAVPNAANLNFGTGDFKIETYFTLTAYTGTAFQQVLLSKGSGLNNNWYLMFDSTNAGQGKIAFTTGNNAAQIYVSSGIADLLEHKLEIIRVNGTITLYVDGAAKGSTTAALYEEANPMLVGTWCYNQSRYAFTGSLRALKIHKGAA
jgi:hypothetical protein